MKTSPLAVVGMSVLYPGSMSWAELWLNIVQGRDQIGEVPPSRWRPEDYWSSDRSAPDRTYSKRGGFIPDVLFDPLDWGIPPAALAGTDPVQLLTLGVARQALRDALGPSLDALPRERVGVFLGASGATQLATTMAARLQRPVWRRELVASGLSASDADQLCDRVAARYPAWSEAVFPGYLNNVIAGRVANRLDLHGTNCTLDAACGSSLAALKMGAQELWLHDADLVLAGGADALCDPLAFLSFAKCSALSKSDDCRPFSSNADGTIIGEGVGLVVLERLEDAERHGRQIYAVIRGIGSSSDGRGTAIYAPSAEGQALAMRRAYANAGVTPDAVELLEAHGTGTPAGELSEVQASRQVFEETGRRDRRWCALGSIKSQIGHSKAAAGVAGLVKAALALHHKVLPGTIKVDQPNPALDLQSSPFYVNARSRPWVRDPGHPRRAAVSSFGFGGSNFHVVLEEHDVAAGGPGRRARSSDVELLAATGADAAAAATECLRVADTLEQTPRALPALARRSRQAYSHQAPARAAVVAASPGEAAARLRSAARRLRGEVERDQPGVCCGIGAAEGRLAFLFPGQGSQYVGMSGAIAMEYPEALAAWDRAAGVPLEEGRRLQDVVLPPPAFGEQERDEQRRRLTATEWAQPALAVASVAWFALLRQLGVRADCVAGHSFGELVALHAAGVLSEEALLRVARRRGELMRDSSAGEGGAMTALLASVEQARELLDGVQDVVIANHNAPAQVVLSGRTAAIAEVEQKLAARGLRFTRLPVASAFHSPLVSASATPFAAYLEGIDLGTPSLDVYGNTTASRYPGDAPAIRASVARQLAEPVRFVEELSAMYEAGVRTFLEVGPRAVLTSLVSASLAGRPHRAIAVDDGSGGLEAWYFALARLVEAGVPMRLDALDAHLAPSAEAPALSSVAVPINGSLSTQTMRSVRALPPAPAAPPANRPEPTAVRGSPEANRSDGSPSASNGTRHREVPVEAAAAQSAPSAAVLRRTVLQVQARYQQAMADAHAAFVAAAGSALSEVEAPVHQPRREQDLGGDVPTASVAPPPERLTAASRTPEQVPGPEASLPAPVARGGEQMMALLTGVVSEKTGFPVEAMQPDMDLERDLGIDSIKRVEILAELRTRIAALADVKPSGLAAHRTLAEIARLLEVTASAVPTALAADAPAAGQAEPDGAGRAAPATSPGQPAGAEPGRFAEILQAVISEKTGFPRELIRPETDLERDLGVDSIKRMEVLVALRTIVPALSTVQPAEVAPLRTVDQIAAFLSRRAP